MPTLLTLVELGAVVDGGVRPLGQHHCQVSSNGQDKGQCGADPEGACRWSGVRVPVTELPGQVTCPVLSQSFQALGCLHTGHSTDLTYSHPYDNLVVESSAGSVLIFLGLSTAFDVADPPPSGKSPHTGFKVSCHWQFRNLFHSQTSNDGELAGPSPCPPPPPHLCSLLA